MSKRLSDVNGLAPSGRTPPLTYNVYPQICGSCINRRRDTDNRRLYGKGF